jgi:hypothetical protein
MPAQLSLPSFLPPPPRPRLTGIPCCWNTNVSSIGLQFDKAFPSFLARQMNAASDEKTYSRRVQEVRKSRGACAIFLSKQKASQRGARPEVADR